MDGRQGQDTGGGMKSSDELVKAIAGPRIPGRENLCDISRRAVQCLRVARRSSGEMKIAYDREGGRGSPRSPAILAHLAHRDGRTSRRRRRPHPTWLSPSECCRRPSPNRPISPAADLSGAHRRPMKEFGQPSG